MLDRTNVKVPIEIANGMQKSRHSSKYDGGTFSAVIDTPTHHFHKWVATALSG